MNLLRTLLGGSKRKPSVKKMKKKLLPKLLDRIEGLPAEALKAKWKRDLWDPRR